MTNVYFKNPIFELVAFPLLVCFRVFLKNILRKAEKLACEYSYDDSYVVGNFIYTFSQKSEMFKKDIFEETVEVVFEGYEFPCVKDYHLYLTQLYGDYMTPPPESKRGHNHGDSEFYIIDVDKGLLSCL